MLDCEVVQTRSGAWSVRDKVTGEVMHPVTGAWAESHDVYVNPSRLGERLSEAPTNGGSDERLVLLDAGLGAGTNALAAWRAVHALSEARRALEILSIDRSLDAFSFAQGPQYASAFGWTPEALSAAVELMAQGQHQTDRVLWRIEVGDLSDLLAKLAGASVDIVYWDPFSASSCPALWTLETFRQLRRVCRPGATVHTFCTSTPARVALLLAGFFVGEGPSTGNSRGTTLAGADARDVERPLGLRFLERVQRSSAPFPEDAPADALEQLQRLEQLQSP